MAALAARVSAQDESNGIKNDLNGNEDPFVEVEQSTQQPYYHRFSSRFELDSTDLGAASSPSQVKRVLEAHLLETERRLQDTQYLGTSLLQQQSELQDKLREVEQQQDEAEISPELKQRLASIGREHDDVSREIARSLLAPKSRVVSGEEKQTGESTTLTSQATGSPTKISAPSRRQRNQPSNRTDDLRFAADISTSLLAQVRQLQSVVAERDEAIKSANAERSRLEQDVQFFAQRLRSQDENEQKYKDENWNLETQKHELLSAQREAVDKEKRLSTMVALANAEKTYLISEIEESKLAHSKVTEEHEAAKKSHETELHSLKRDFDAAELERNSLQHKIDELTAQNQELAKTMAARFRNQSPQRQPEFGSEEDGLPKDMSTPEHSPPPSPTKATPRHGGLESETLKSSLHHAHRMIQNLKSNIHREKTEKIELKRMLQDARDELEQRRSDSGFGAGMKRQKTKDNAFKKPARPEILGSNRRARTDVEMQDDDWEDQTQENRDDSVIGRDRSAAAVTDLSDAYQTAHETESNFETADERMTTESEAFETGAESLAGDSSDDLTETESTAPRPSHQGSVRGSRPSQAFRSVGSRDSFLSTASTSADEDDDQLQTPVQSYPNRFKLRNGRSSSVRRTQIYDGTPDSVRTQVTSQESPATVTEGRSPPAVEQSLFAELEGINDSSSNFSTPARSAIIDMESSPTFNETPSRSFSTIAPPPVSVVAVPKPIMVDSGMMTEPWHPEPLVTHPQVTVLSDPSALHLPIEAETGSSSRAVSIGEFPLPPTTPASSSVRHADAGTQYTPKRGQPSTPAPQQQVFEASAHDTPAKALQESPIRGVNNFITPPRTVWDAEHESELGSPEHNVVGVAETSKQLLAYSGMLTQNTVPLSPVLPKLSEPESTSSLAYSTILSQQTHPIIPPSSPPPTAPLPPLPSAAKEERNNSAKAAAGAATGGLLAGAAAALGLSWSKDNSTPNAVEDDVNAASLSAAQTQSTSRDASAFVTTSSKSAGVETNLRAGLPVIFSSKDQSSQTMLTSHEVEQALHAKKTTSIPVVVPPMSAPIQDVRQRSLARSPDLPEPPVLGSSSAPTSPPLRPSSASSWRPSTANRQHPPLPSDYKTNIARANSLVQNNAPPGSLRKESGTLIPGTVMGPPLMPASAMRRPKTPAESTRSPSRENATPRTANSVRYRGTESHVSRRSSISSFASEIDERFNIRAGAGQAGYGAAPGTDPRMIQAITQTMIGEYLWKYTRKTGSKEMSSTRHRRYFWVHPYTKTLYWSTTDPSLPGAKEGTSRSVPIESIRVVSDDNPMPPGLHRKSLEVTTPGRKVKFTASTGQRHETWFNALSYLLLRGEPADTQGAYSTGGNEITRDDVEEFRASGYDPHLVPQSRASMSSYNSRTTAGTSKRISNQRQALPANVVSNTASLRQQGSVTQNSSVPPANDSGRDSRAESTRDMDKNRTIRASSVSRVSRMLGSITGRTSKQAIHQRDESQAAEHERGQSRQSNSIYNASVVSATRDSAEEARQEMLRQEAMGLGPNGGLENVRACCDGKHDVSTLTHSHRHSDRNGALSSMSDRINRSMSKRI